MGLRVVRLKKMVEKRLFAGGRVGTVIGYRGEGLP